MQESKEIKRTLDNLGRKKKHSKTDLGRVTGKQNHFSSAVKFTHAECCMGIGQCSQSRPRSQIHLEHHSIQSEQGHWQQGVRQHPGMTHRSGRLGEYVRGTNFSPVFLVGLEKPSK